MKRPPGTRPQIRAGRRTNDRGRDPKPSASNSEASLVGTGLDQPQQYAVVRQGSQDAGRGAGIAPVDLERPGSHRKDRIGVHELWDWIGLGRPAGIVTVTRSTLSTKVNHPARAARVAISRPCRGRGIGPDAGTAVVTGGSLRAAGGTVVLGVAGARSRAISRPATTRVMTTQVAIAAVRRSLASLGLCPNVASVSTAVSPPVLSGSGSSPANEKSSP
jgi:hypothetical protein